MGFLLGGSGTGSAHHPGQILLVESGHFTFSRKGVVEALLFGLEILFIITFITEDIGFVDLPDGVGHRIQKIPVMGHHQEGAFVGRKPVLQPFDHVVIQMVGGLIQDQKITGSQECGGKSRSFFLPAGQKLRTDFRIGDTEPLQHGFGFPFGVPVLFFSGYGGSHVFKDGFLRVKDRILCEKGDLQTVPGGDFSFVRFKASGQNGEDRGLSGAIDPDDPDPVLIVDPRCHIAEDDFAAQGDADVFESQYIHKCFAFYMIQVIVSGNLLYYDSNGKSNI